MTKLQLAQLICAYGNLRVMLHDAEQGKLHVPQQEVEDKMAHVKALIESEIGEEIPESLQR